MGEAVGQLKPGRTYYPVGQPLEIQVQRPRGDDPEPLAVELRQPADGAAVARAEVEPGTADLAELFKAQYASDSAARPAVLYAQLLSGGEPVGPALVVQPMTAPARAAAADARGLSVRFTDPREPYVAGYRVYVDQRVVLTTTAGELEFALRPDAAPNTAWNFRELVRGGLYDGTVFHRIIGSGTPGRGFMIQGGDPLGTGLGGPGFAIALENSPLPHDFGVLSMARQSAPDTAGSQFFVVLSREAARPLDGAYAAFGQLVRGGDVLRKLAATPTGPDDRPIEPPQITAARLIDAPPFVGVKPVVEELEPLER